MVEEAMQPYDDNDKKPDPPGTTRPEYEIIVAKYKALIDVPRDEKGFRDEDITRERVDDLFDPDLVREVEGEEKISTKEDVLQEMINLGRCSEVKFQIFRYKQVAPDVIDYYLRYATDTDQFVMKGVSYFRNGKVYKVQVKRTTVNKVPGQHSAEKDTPLTTGETERDFGCRIHELPSMVHGKLLGREQNMIPVEEKYELLRIFMEYEHEKAESIRGLLKQTFLFWRDDFTLRLMDSNLNPYVDGACFHVSKRAGGSLRITLLDGKQNVIAFSEKHHGQGFYTIFGSTALLDGGDDHAVSQPKMEQVDSAKSPQPFFPWLRLQMSKTLEGCLYFVSVITYTVAMGDNDNDKQRTVEFEPLYKISQESDNSNTVSLTICDYYESKDHLGVIKKTPSKHSTSHDDHAPPRIEVNVAPGVDPALVLFLAACLETMDLTSSSKRKIHCPVVQGVFHT